MTCLHFLQRSIFFKLPIAEDIRDVSRDNRNIPPEKLGHLFLGHPQRLILKTDVELDSLLRRVEQE